MPPLAFTVRGTLASGLTMWRHRFWSILAIATVIWLPALVFHGLFMAGVGGPDGAPANALLGLLIMTTPYAHVADQLVAARVQRGEYGTSDGIRASRLADLRRWIALLTTAVLVHVAVLAGACLLLVPGLLVAVLFSVATTTVSAEHRSPLAALRRSVHLTRGQRWRVAGVLAVLWGVRWAGRLVLPYGADATGAPWLLVVGLGLAAVFDLVASAATAAVQVVLYRRLRDRLDGSSDLAAIFG